MPYLNDEHGGGSRPQPTAAPLNWRATPKAADTPIAQSYNDLKAVNESYREFLGAVQAQADQYRTDPEAVKTTIDAFTGTQAAGLVDTAVNRAAENTAAARAEYNRVRESLSPKGDAAAELRNQRSLQRAERDLGQASAGEAAIKAAQLIRDADAEARGLLLQELPSILATRGVPAEVVEKAALSVVPELADAANRVKAAERDEQVIRHGANAVRDGFRRHSPAIALVDPAKTK
jgi:hypothetical protein